MRSGDVMLRGIFIICLLFFPSITAFVQTQRIALADFLAHRNKENYDYLGKGISEMIAL
jgi:hypothetical protein